MSTIATQQRSIPVNRDFASTTDLPRVSTTYGGVEGLQTVPRVARDWIPYFASWLKIGYHGLKTTIGALTAAHYRACPNANRSERSTYSALRWLEDNGWIRRRVCHLGPDRLGVTIEIISDRFSFFLHRTQGKNYPTSNYITTPLQVSQGDNLTNNPSTLELQTDNYSASSANNKQCAKSAIEEKNRTKPVTSTHRYDPVWFSCRVILENQNAADKPVVLRRIDAEQKGKTQKTSADWQYWSSNWSRMSHAEREHYAENDILPAVREQLTVENSSSSSPKVNNIAQIVSLLTDENDKRLEDLEPRPALVISDGNGYQELKDANEIADLQHQIMWKRKNLGLA